MKHRLKLFFFIIFFFGDASSTDRNSLKIYDKFGKRLGTVEQNKIYDRFGKYIGKLENNAIYYRNLKKKNVIKSDTYKKNYK